MKLVDSWLLDGVAVVDHILSNMSLFVASSNHIYRRRTLHSIIANLAKHHHKRKNGVNGSRSTTRRSSSSSAAFLLPSVQIEEHDCAKSTQDQMTEIVRPHCQSQTPVLLRHAVQDMPALQTWTSWDYLEQAAGSDTACFAELGGNYATTPAAETRCHIPFGDYISYLRLFEERHGRRPTNASTTPSSEELVYMAQNDLPHGLQPDVNIPSFCTQLGHNRLYSTMIWIGPHGCVSPFHYDPLDNCYLQIVGLKRLWLYPPEAGLYLYAGGGSQLPAQALQANTSPINPRQVNRQRYPLVSKLPHAVEALLTPGDVLFLPHKWWHYVVTEETSVSVNQWWR